MAKGVRYSDEFKRDAVSQIVERGYSVQDVADRLGISTKALYGWKAKFGRSKVETGKDAELRKLKAELARVTEERDILKLEGLGNDLGDHFPRTTRRRTSRERHSEYEEDRKIIQWMIFPTNGVHRRTSCHVLYPLNVPYAAGPSQWVLRLAQSATE